MIQGNNKFIWIKFSDKIQSDYLFKPYSNKVAYSNKMQKKIDLDYRWTLLAHNSCISKGVKEKENLCSVNITVIIH